jgi:hypothetical protein
MDFLSQPWVTPVGIVALIAIAVWWFKFRQPGY